MPRIQLQNPNFEAAINVTKYAGVDRTGSTDSTAGVALAALDAIALHKPLYFPAGEYVIGSAAATAVPILGLTYDFEMYGDGLLSRIKRKDSSATADFSKLFKFTSGSAAGVNLHIHDLYVNDNATNNPLPVAARPIVIKQWLASTAYAVGDFAYNDTNKLYRCTVAGTSAGSGGPTGTTMSNITDSGVTWRYVGAWQATTAYIVGDQVTNGGNYYYCSTAGTSAGSVGPTGTSTTPQLDGSAYWQYSDSFALEHCHVFSVEPSGVYGFREVKFDRITATDPVADVCTCGSSTSSNTLGDFTGDRIYVYGRTRERSDFIATCSYDNFVLTNSNVYRIETEINSANTGSLGRTAIADTNCDVLDLNYPTLAVPCLLTNVNVGKYFWSLGYNVKAANCNFRLYTSSRIGIVSGGADVRMEFHGCSFAAIAGFTTSVSAYLVQRTTTATAPKEVLFDSCVWTNESVTVITAFWGDDNAPITGGMVTFRGGSMFCGTNTSQAIYFRSGQQRVEKVRFNGACVNSAYILQGATSGSVTDNNVHLIDNIAETTAKYLIEPPISGNAVSYWMRGNRHVADGVGGLIGFTRYDKIGSPRGAGSLLYFKELDTGGADAVPSTGKFAKGARVFATDPTTLGFEGWECTVGGNGDGTSATGATNGASFRHFGQIIQVGSVSTTDATVTTILTIPITTNAQTTLMVMVSARRTGGSAGAAADGASYIRGVSVKDNAGTPTIIGSSAMMTDQESQAGWDVTFDISTTNLRVRVTGATNNNIDWSASARILAVT